MTQVKINRRQFLKSSALLSVGALVGGMGPLFTSNAQEVETDKRRAAKYVMQFASPYSSAEALYIPHMHREFKENIEQFSQGRIFVEIVDAGHVGIGTELMAAVTRGQVACALISVSNLSRALPILDILNIPFWASNDQAYLNLITSSYWQQNVLDVIKAKSPLEVLYHYVVGARTLSATKSCGRIFRLPNELNNVVVRVPASRVLAQFYKMTPANVVEVPWSKVADMARTGHIDVLDPGVVGLYAGPYQLRDQVGAISTLQSVPDAWVNVVNQTWLNNLPRSLREAVTAASDATFKMHLKTVHQTYERCLNQFIQRGVQVYHPNESERAVWNQQFGHHNLQWRAIKRELLGTVDNFEALLAATKEASRYQLD
ncbi:TRAP transporter substrate-binding protein DctP [Pseudoalteromonas xiamenensis]